MSYIWANILITFHFYKRESQAGLFDQKIETGAYNIYMTHCFVCVFWLENKTSYYIVYTVVAPFFISDVLKIKLWGTGNVLAWRSHRKKVKYTFALISTSQSNSDILDSLLYNIERSISLLATYFNKLNILIFSTLFFWKLF